MKRLSKKYSFVKEKQIIIATLTGHSVANVQCSDFVFSWNNMHILGMKLWLFDCEMLHPNTMWLLAAYHHIKNYFYPLAIFPALALRASPYGICMWHQWQRFFRRVDFLCSTSTSDSTESKAEIKITCLQVQLARNKVIVYMKEGEKRGERT